MNSLFLSNNADIVGTQLSRYVHLILGNCLQRHMCENLAYFGSLLGSIIDACVNVHCLCKNAVVI